MIDSSDLVKGAKFIGEGREDEENTPVITFEEFNKHGDCNFIPSDESIKYDEGCFFLPIHIATRHLVKYEGK